MPDQNRSVAPGPDDRSVRTDKGVILRPPADWQLLPPGDAALTRRVKAEGPAWTVSEKRGRKTFSRGVWAPAERIERITKDLQHERSDPAYTKKLEAGRRRRSKLQEAYVVEFTGSVREFLAFSSPHIELAEEHTVPIAIENHANNLIESPDSMKWLAELTPSPHLAIAFAPYHLPQDTQVLSKLIRQLDHHIAVFYAWQHGNGCMNAQPKESELLQMPGRGELDFAPLMEALVDIRYRGWTEIFMHPFPRGIPILESTSEVTEEINRARDYLTKCIA